MIASKQTRYGTDNKKWDAVLGHDTRADGAFLFAVKTTGIYCRPSCRSRTPHRENVAFYPSCQAAERAGFRPCKRCQPDGPGLQERESQLVARACRLLESTETPLKLDELARAVGMSPFHFHRLFRKITGLTPKAYATAHREETMRRKLPRGGSITATIYDAGYSSNARFYAKSSRMLGMKPRAFRRGGIGETIRFATGKCSLGFILVATSEKGVCAIFLGDKPELLSRELQHRFPKAHIAGADREFQKLIARVINLVENPAAETSLPLDVRGTVFQQKVWNALTQIPLGKTASYTQIAKKIGLPKAVRAVAGACAANLLAVAIPCHRVVRTDGSLSGYRWGVERKSALLRREAIRHAPCNSH